MHKLLKTTELLGKIFNQEERANEIIDFYTSKTNEVKNRLSETEKEKPSVYIEVGSKGPAEYGNSYGDSVMWGALAKDSGGDNIAAGIINTWEPINPEFLLRANPDYIIMTGSYWPATPDSLRLGFLSTEEASQELLKSFTQRSGWEGLKAVENKNVYAIHHGLGREMYDCAATEFFAKVLYTEEFADINPMATLQEYYDRFLPFDLSGVWMMQLK
ncbi:substrate-binding protein [Anaerovirgula multivorans]|uniref:Substrate-binding protein n=2 Tax=Anaerovirgula multivorans TaxID=312168 RepID=A0A239IKK8_9FIRM|nr:substrate-binding protein [Anaerovirgula multivorans]